MAAVDLSLGPVGVWKKEDEGFEGEGKFTLSRDGLPPLRPPQRKVV